MPQVACAVYQCSNNTIKLMHLKKEICEKHNSKKGNTYLSYYYLLSLIFQAFSVIPLTSIVVVCMPCVYKYRLSYYILINIFQLQARAVVRYRTHISDSLTMHRRGRSGRNLFIDRKAKVTRRHGHRRKILLCAVRISSMVDQQEKIHIQRYI